MKFYLHLVAISDKLWQHLSKVHKWVIRHGHLLAIEHPDQSRLSDMLEQAHVMGHSAGSYKSSHSLATELKPSK